MLLLSVLSILFATVIPTVECMIAKLEGTIKYIRVCTNIDLFTKLMKLVK
jgi:hypothetical protein